MERRDLYQDDLTEERYPSPASRDDAATTQVLDPDASADDGDAAPLPRAVNGDSETEDDDDDDEDDEDDEDDDD